MAAVVQIFMAYPPDIQMQAVHAIVVRTNSPTLKFIKDTCDEIYEPRRRAEEREQLTRDRKLQLPPPRPERTAEQLARAAAQVAEIRKAHGIPDEGVVKPQQAPPVNHDGNHMSRIAADLERRRQINAMRQEEGNEASNGV
jgi:hypothetical protein